jgi:hypothetical protein
LRYCGLLKRSASIANSSDRQIKWDGGKHVGDEAMIDLDAPPYIAVGRKFFSKAFLEAVWNDLIRKIPIWEAGIVEPTNAERLAYDMLRPLFGAVAPDVDLLTEDEES